MPAPYEPALFLSEMSNIPMKTTFHLEVVFGAASLASAWGKDMAISRVSAGKYTVTFPRSYRKLVGAKWMWTSLAAGPVFFPVVLTDAIVTPSATGGGTLTIELRTEAGVATDPSAGDKIQFQFDVSLDSLVDGYPAPVS